MRRLERIVVQLEESKRFILTDTEPYLRMALLLLDNAAEVLMQRKVRDELWRDTIYARMHQIIDETPAPAARKEERRRQIGHTPLSAKRKKSISWSFTEKVRFLSEDKSYIPQPAARVLCYLHKYRNEAYHLDKVRKDSIRPATVLLFGILCDLLVWLPPSSWSYSVNEDVAWLAKYQVELHAMGQGAAQISSQLKNGLPLDIAGLRSSVTTHLNERVEELRGAIHFVIENTDAGSDEEETLKALQLWLLDRRRDPRLRDQTFRDFQPAYTIASIERWQDQIYELEEIEDKLALFDRFADIEEMAWGQVYIIYLRRPLPLLPGECAMRAFSPSPSGITIRKRVGAPLAPISSPFAPGSGRGEGVAEAEILLPSPVSHRSGARWHSSTGA